MKAGMTVPRMTHHQKLALVEGGVDLVGDLRVQLGELAPVRAGVLVVNGVEAVVEHEEVEDAAGDVARVVVLRPRVGVDVLHVVEPHHRVRCRTATGRPYVSSHTFDAEREAVHRDREHEQYRPSAVLQTVYWVTIWRCRASGSRRFAFAMYS